MQTVQAIDRALPILHSGPGCAQKLSESTGSSGYFSPNIFPCTSINEKDVVFGGVKKLDSTIGNALKVIDADLYVVLTGCIPEIVGDDSGEVVSRYEDAEKPVVYAPTAGFKGNNYKGHEQVVDAIVDQYLKKSDKKQKGLINIWADVPYQDLFWLGNLRQLRIRIFSGSEISVSSKNSSRSWASLRTRSSAISAVSRISTRSRKRSSIFLFPRGSA